MTKLIVGLLLAFTLVLTGHVVTGCANKPTARAVAYHTLKDTQILVDNAMQVYAEKCVTRKVSVAKQAQIDAVHAKYRAAYRDAVSLAQLDYSKLTPDTVAALASTLLNLISQL